MTRAGFKNILLFAAAFLYGLCGAANAQDYLVRNWQTEDGLPDNTVTAIQRTPDGYLWIGTFNGLARFDGVQFKVFDSASTPELSGSRILSLLTDRAGSLFIGTEGGGLVKYTDGRFNRIPLGVFGNSGDVTALFQDTNDVVWARVAGCGLARLPDKRPPVEFFDPTNGMAADALAGLSNEAAVQDWITAGNNLLTFRGGGWLSRPSQVPPDGSEIIAVQRSRNGAVWIAYPRRLLRLSPNGAAQESYPWGADFSSALVTSVAEDQNGKLWVGTLNNGLLHSTKPGEFAPVVSEGPLSQNVISAVYEDRDGAIWAGCYRGGLFRIKPRNVQTLMPPGAGEVNVQTVCAACDGAIWLGTGGAGLYRYADGKFTQYAEASGLANQHVCAVFEDSHTNLWVGTWGGLFLREGETFRRVQGAGLIPERVLALYEDRAGDLWVGGYGGLARKHNDHWTEFTPANGLSHPDVRVMAEDRAGNLWVGTAGGGLDRFRDGRFTHLGEAEGFRQKIVLALWADAADTLWIGTIGGGLTRFQDGKFTAYTTQDGLADNIIGGIIEDKLGNLWLSSQNGILRVSKQALNEYEAGRSPPLPCLSLSVGDGLATPMCSGAGQPVAACAADGQLWVPNMKAVAVIEPSLILPRAVPPSVVIEEVSIDGRDFAPQFNAPLLVPYGRSRFEFHYTALGLPAPEAARFRCRLEGFDKEWINTGVRRAAYYGQLPPGRYKFRVLAAGSDGVWHEASSPLLLNVVPRLWELRWFQVLAGMTFVAVLGGTFTLYERRKLRRRLERAEMQQALENERRRIFRDLHDDLGARLTEIALMGEVANRYAHQPGTQEIEVGAIAQKVREVIVTIGEVIWTTNPHNDSLPNLAAFLCDHTERFLTAAQISCRLEVAGDLPDVPLTAQYRHHLLLVVKEALNNSVKHAGAGKIWLKIQVEGDRLCVEVTDDGRGFDPQNPAHTGNGLQNIQARMESMHGRIEIRSQPGRGTSVTLRLPLARIPAA